MRGVGPGRRVEDDGQSAAVRLSAMASSEDGRLVLVGNRDSELAYRSVYAAAGPSTTQFAGAPPESPAGTMIAGCLCCEVLKCKHSEPNVGRLLRVKSLTEKSGSVETQAGRFVVFRLSRSS